MAAGLGRRGRRAACGRRPRRTTAAAALPAPGRGRARPGPSLVVRDPAPRAAMAAPRPRARFRRDWATTRWGARAEAEVLAADVGAGPARPAARRAAAAELAAELRPAGAALGRPRQPGSGARRACWSGAARLEARPDRLRPRPGRGPAHRWPCGCTDRDVRAELAERTAGAPHALAHVRAGLDDLHAWQSSFGSLDLQTNVVGHGVRLGGARAGAGGASRGRTRCCSSGRSGPGCWPRGSSRCGRRRTRRPSPTWPSCGPGRRPEREAELRRRIREQAWQRKGSGEVADPVALAELQAGLGDGTALVAYVVTAERVVGPGGHVDRHRCATTSATATELDARARRAAARPRHGRRRTCRTRWPGRCAARWPAGSTRSAALLVAPLLDRPRRPPRRAHAVRRAGRCPVDAAARAGRPAGHRRPERHLVAGPSADAAADRLGRLRRRPARRTRGGGGAGGRRGLAPGARSSPATDATAAAVSELAGRVDVLHVAAHGRHSAENPLFSGLELVDGTVVRLRHRPAARACPTSCCSRPARSAARRCAGARS